jgi:amino acid adenylation domain-containing protein
MNSSVFPNMEIESFRYAENGTEKERISIPDVNNTQGASGNASLDQAKFVPEILLSRSMQELSVKSLSSFPAFLLSALEIFVYRYTGEKNLKACCAIDTDTSSSSTGAHKKFILENELNEETAFQQLLSGLNEKILTASNTASDNLFNGQEFSFQFSFFSDPQTADTETHASIHFVITTVPEPVITIIYNTTIFTRQTIERLGNNYLEILRSVTGAPETIISKVPFLSKEEEQLVLHEFNQTREHYPAHLNYVDLFSEQVAKTPDAIAVAYASAALSYRELDERSNQMAAFLASRGVKTEDFVGICMDRSIEMIVAILGIIKAGAAYVPMDPEYPAERIRYMLEDTGMKQLLTVSHLRSELDNACKDHNINITDVDGDWPLISAMPSAAPPIIIKPGNLCYLIYTSGSTGKPKGVMNEHRGLVNRLLWTQQYFQLTSHDVILQKTTYCFDVSVWELLWAFIAGAKLVFADPGAQKNTEELRRLINKHQVTTIHFVPSMLETFLLGVNKNDCQSLKRVLCSGEALTKNQVTLFQGKLNHAGLFNLYGPTEAAIDVSCWDVIQEPAKISIGKPVANTSLYILDGNMKPVPIGALGELYIGGIQVARGYLKLPELTEAKFIKDIFSADPSARLYRTGDLACWLPNGNIEYLGRIDDQVKIRGFRIELGEVENKILSFKGIRQCVVSAVADATGSKKLVAYIVPNQPGIDTKPLIDFMKQELPEYMIPSLFIEIEQVPLSANGKINRKALPKPSGKRPELSVLFKAASSPAEKNIEKIWQDLLQIERIGVNDNFFELGGNSLLALKAVALLKERSGYEIPVTKLYQYPTINALSAFIEKDESSLAGTTGLRRTNGNDEIAVIGMAGRFPGANTIAEFWNLLVHGKETIRFFKDEELDPSIPLQVKKDPAYVKARGIIDEPGHFDAEFFGINPRMAEVMDPQQRIFLEIAWEVLESTGHLAQHYTGNVGVFAGGGYNYYYAENVLPNKEVVNRIGAFQVVTYNDKDYIATRTSYQLNLKGPSVSVHSACSTSLLAIAEAVESIRKGQCDVAIAGAASVTSPVNSGHIYQEGAMLSNDGSCRPFDRNARGTVFSDGAGVVLLKRRADAERDGDTIYAVIKGVGMNNDGGGKGSFTAPSTEGQAGAIRMALEDAQVDPSTISYIETHGTGTPLGDPIEIEGLKLAFGKQHKNQFCAVGSVKSNMGHLTAAAGVAGLIKTALSLYYKTIPASINFSDPNPNIDFANSPFYVNDRLSPWKSDQKRRAGISSFGVGGTNVHVIMEEVESPSIPSITGRPAELICFSARNAQSREAYATRLAQFVEEHPALSIADLAFNLRISRQDFNTRRFVSASGREELIAKLRATDFAASTAKQLKENAEEIVFSFPGQGSQSVNMGGELYRHEPVFKDAVDRCAVILQGYMGEDIREVIYPRQANQQATDRINNTYYTQPAMFVIEYAMASLWMSWGIQPGIFIGHSIGEFVAAHFAGVFTLEDGLKLIHMRAKLMHALPAGSMLSVRAELPQIEKLLAPELSLAAINSPGLSVVAGPSDQIKKFSQTLDDLSIANKLLYTSHAFHSSMMEPIVEPFREIVKSVKLNAPSKPVVSTVTGTWMTDAQATDPAYWAKHLRSTVRFSEALNTLSQKQNIIILESGPRSVLTTLARQQMAGKKLLALASMDTDAENSSEYAAITRTLGQLWINGIDPDWKKYYRQEAKTGPWLRLPSYAFDKKLYWLKPVEQSIIHPEKNNAPVAAITEAAPNTKPLQAKIMRTSLLSEKVKDILEDASGIDAAQLDNSSSFIEMGLDSLLLTQLALTLKKNFGLPVTFRQLNEQLGTIDLLVRYLDQNLPADAFQPAPAVTQEQPAQQHLAQAEPVNEAQHLSTNYNQQQIAQAGAAYTAPATMYQQPVQQVFQAQPEYAAQAQAMYQQPVMVAQPGSETALNLIAQQLQLLGKQLALLQGAPMPVAVPVQQPAPVQQVFNTLPAEPKQPVQAMQQPPQSMSLPAAETRQPAAASAKPLASLTELSAEEQAEIKKPFGATARIEKKTTELNDKQKKFLEDLTRRYNARTAKSKEYTQRHRAHMADPRVVSGFRPLTKEIVYSIVINKSKGSRLWDIDGNEYIDLLNGFGSNMLGYQPEVISNALHKQIDAGIEVGPQHELAGEVCELIAGFTGHERVALCNTGSEAVLGAMRIARTTTGRSLIVAFSGSYHGIVDEVVIRGTKKLKSFPAAPGIMPESVQNMLILDYGTDESLRIIRERAHELAAVLVEPVQSRRPEFQPVAFLKELRNVTAASGTALIFDEVITGFRMHPGGAQALFGVKADIATYGKVVGAGISIGVIAGKTEFMNSLDGGFWQYGDQSSPEAGVTYFAGTFVRHPLALASSKASLQYMKMKGPDLQKGLTEKASYLAAELNSIAVKWNLPLSVVNFGSLWRIRFKEELPYNELLFTLMRDKGLHILDGFPCFMTEAHTMEELNFAIEKFKESVRELVEAGFLAGSNIPVTINGKYRIEETPPVPGARLGKDADGNPCWFISDPQRPGKFMKVNLTQN